MKPLRTFWASLSWTFAALRARYGDHRLWISGWAVVTALIVVSMSTMTIGEMIHLSAHSEAHQTAQATPSALPLPTRRNVDLALSASSEVLAWVACTGTGSTCTKQSVRGFRPTGAVALLWVCQVDTSQDLPGAVITIHVIGSAGTSVTSLTEYCPSSVSSAATSGVIIENYPPGYYILTTAQASSPSWFVLVVQVHA